MNALNINLPSEIETNNQLVKLLEKLELVNFFLDAIEDFIKRSPVVIENINEEIIRLREQNAENNTLKENLELISKLISILSSDKFKNTIEGVIKAYEEVMEKDERKGLIGILKSTSDPDVQRSLAFLILALKAVGKAMKE